VKEWMSSPVKFCGLNIPSFAERAERMHLSKRNALRCSKNLTVREMWAMTNGMNIKTDDLLCNSDFKTAKKQVKEKQSNAPITHFLGLKSQGLIAKTVSELIFPKQIENWKKSIEQLPSFAYNFARKAMMNQLPTLKNLKLWGC